MARRSSIDQLDPAIRSEVDLAVKRGATTDDIVAHLQLLGADVSRSAVGRYTKRYRDLAARQRDMASVASAFSADFGDSDNDMGKMLIQLVTSIAARAAMPLATADKPDVDGQELHFYARAVKDILSAAKIDTDRDEKVARIAAEKMKRQAAEIAEQSARKAGASEETIQSVKADIMGIAL